MAERLRRPITIQPPGFSGSFLKWLGFALVCCGSLGAMIRWAVLKMDTLSGQALADALSPEGGMMLPASVSVIGGLAATLAIPIYAKLLAVGLRHTSDRKKYLLRLGVLALVSEIPYDLCTTGRLFDFTEQNPVWALLMAALALTVISEWEMNGRKAGVGLTAAMLLVALLWAMLLRTRGAVAALLILLSALFFLTRGEGWLPTVGGVVLSFLQPPAPFAMIFVFWYDGTPTALNKKLFYILYPAQLLAFGLLGLILR